jgi:hypothetical protein
MIIPQPQEEYHVNRFMVEHKPSRLSTASCPPSITPIIYVIAVIQATLFLTVVHACGVAVIFFKK